MKVVIAGGAHIMDQTGMFNIGEKNYEALKNGLANYDVSIHHEDIGGTNSRKLSLRSEADPAASRFSARQR